MFKQLILATVALGMLAGLSAAQPPEEPVVLPPENGGNPLPMDVLPEPIGVPEPSDGPFERYVDISQVAGVLESRDAAKLTDLALQLATGEQTLLRNHQSGVTSASLFQKALTIAAEAGSKDIIERIGRAAVKFDDKDLQQKVAAAKLLSSESRSASPAAMVDVLSMKPEAYRRFKLLHDTIRSAALVKDADQLRDAVSLIQEFKPELGEDRAKYLSELAAKASSEIPKTLSEQDKALNTLLSSSRGWGIKDVVKAADPTNKNSGIRKTGREVDQARIKAMEGALHGGNFSVTLRNPNKGEIYYLINNQKQIALLPNSQIRVTGAGKCNIRFQSGSGGEYSYDLGSGKSYTFRWKEVTTHNGKEWNLNLYGDD
jgi:hypothetical protein